MNPFKKFVLIFSAALAFFAGNATAACNITLLIQLPQSWSASFSIFERGNNSWHPYTYSPGANGWFSVNMSSHGGNAGNSFVIAQNNNAYDGNTIIGPDGIRTGRPDNGQAFTCPGGGATYYLTESPSTPGQIYFSQDIPNAYNLYFLPPGDDVWTLGTPHLVYMDGGNLKKSPMRLDASSCGWYRITFADGLTPATPPNDFALIWPGPDPLDQVGLLGLDEDPENWPEGEPTPFNLVTLFGDDRDLYFVPADGAGGWHKTDQRSRDGICSYTFAAIIYDTDIVNTSFHTCSENCGSSAGVGVIKGIPKNTLVLEDGVPKMEWNNPSSTDGWTKQNFDDAFRPTPGKNVMRCYDMPFKRNASGLWEYNSDKLCANGVMDLNGNCSSHGGYMGGFFPPELQTRGTADYNN
ncbi:MAG: hypothetical protein FWH22_03230, partial [Fibromonadales bacterium]|nr:hypothetical protein [Fibromonadales bacterium]